MNPRPLTLALAGGVFLAAVSSGHGAPPPSVPLSLRSVRPSESSGSAGAVVVADLPLAHTAQVFPLNEGKLAGPGDAGKQAAQVLLNLSDGLREARSDLSRAVKLNVYVTAAGHVEAVQRTLAGYFAGARKPAVSFVETLLPVPGALVAMDAVAVSDAAPPAGAVNHYRVPGMAGAKSLAHVSVLPAGKKIFVSGQADRGNDLAEATTRTLEGLEDTLKFAGLTRAHIVQVKAFFGPMAKMADVERAFVEFFRGGTIPPLVFVEWLSATPIEIELIAAGGAAGGAAGEAIEFLTPPKFKASPIYTKVTRVNRGQLIYFSGLYPPAGRDGAAQVREVFGELRQLLADTGGDFKHLAKATYYVANEDVSKQLNAIRPDYYDPQRPPAASKIAVRGVAMPGRAFTMDMIGVVK